MQDSGTNTIVPHICNVQFLEPARFFFAKYAINEPHSNGNYYDWLVESYLEPRTNNVVRVVIDAIGMAGMSNVLNVPRLASLSKERYGEALAAMQSALVDPAQATADTTLMAMILLGMLEVPSEHRCSVEDLC